MNDRVAFALIFIAGVCFGIAFGTSSATDGILENCSALGKTRIYNHVMTCEVQK